MSLVFVDLGGGKNVTSMKGSTYPMILRDNFPRYPWMYFVSHKSDAANA